MDRAVGCSVRYQEGFYFRGLLTIFSFITRRQKDAAHFEEIILMRL